MLVGASLCFPAWYFCAIAFYKWRDDNWRISRFVKVCLVQAQLFVLALNIIIGTCLEDGYQLSCIIFVVNMIVLWVLYLLSQWVANGFYLSGKLQRYSAKGIMSVVFVAGIVYGETVKGEDSRFLGFTVRPTMRY